MRRILQGMGAEVIHLGHNRSVDEVVTAALQEDVQGIAISSYQGGHVEYFKYMVDLLRERGGAHIQVFGGGGGVIVPGEIAELQAYGVDAHLQPRGRPAHGPGRDDRRDDDALRRRPRRRMRRPSLGADPRPASRRRGAALAQLITALENGRPTPALLAELRAAAAPAEDAGARHHRHRRRRQVEPHRRADPAPAPRPGRRAAASPSSRSTRRAARAAARCSATASA